MLDKFFHSLKNDGIHKASTIMTMGSNIIKVFEQEFAENHDAKMAGIDTLIYILTQHKEAVDAEVAKKAEDAAAKNKEPVSS
jgi:hypothetical protein